jgi:hypothetical protein
MELDANERAAAVTDISFLTEFVIPMIGCSRYSKRAEMGASHGREIFPRKVAVVPETSGWPFVE